MAFISNEEIEVLEPHEKNEWWISLYLKGEIAFMSLAGIFAFIILVFFTMSIEFPENMIAFMWLVRVALFAISAAIILFLLALERGAMIEFIQSFQTETWKDNIGYGSITILILVIFGVLDYYGAGKFLNFVNKYEPKVIHDPNSDKRISSNFNDRKTLKQERDEKIKSMKCVECATIEAKYNLQISKKEQGKKKAKSSHTEGDRRYIANYNTEIDREISKIISKRDNEEISAQAKFEAKKDSIENSYDKRINSVDTMNLSLKSTIDSSNKKEIAKGEEVELENRRYGGFISPFIIIFLCFIRYKCVEKCRESNMAWHAIGEFMASSNYLSILFAPLVIFFTEKLEIMKIDNSVRYSRVFENIESHIEKTGATDLAKTFIDKGVKSMDEAKKYYEKSQKKVVNITESGIDLQQINDILQGYYILLEMADPSEISEINSIIEGYKILLSL